MSSYVDNIVTSYDGTQAKRSDCRFIKGEYYIKNKQCFLFNGKWIRINSKYIVFDHENKAYLHIDDSHHLIEGVIDINNDKSFIFGKFSPNIYNNGSILEESSGNTFTIINIDIALNNNYIFSNNILIKNNKSKILNKVVSYNNLPYNYSSSDTMMYFNNTKNTIYYKNILNTNNFIYLHNSYGIEYETDNGTIPESLCLRYGLIPLRDGSLRKDGYIPYEYATIPLNGNEVFSITKKHTGLLKTYCKLNHMSSLHFHQGNHELSKEYILAYYNTCYLLQDEIYSLFPSYVARSTEIGKDKDYCKKIHSLQELVQHSNIDYKSNLPEEKQIQLLYAALYYFLEGTHIPADNELYLKTNHASNPNNNSKWHINQRYYAVNFIPLLFSNKRTIEWRLHTPTFNFNKIASFIMLLDAIASFVQKNKKDLALFKINKLTINDVLANEFSHSKRQYLNTYFNWRKINCINYNQIKQREILLDELVTFNDELPFENIDSIIS